MSTILAPAATGSVARVAGPVVVARLPGARLYDLVLVGPDRLAGEIIRLDDERATVQVYEDTTGLRVGDPVSTSGEPLTALLGPGLLGSIVDGVQRRLTHLAGDPDRPEPFLDAGGRTDGLDLDRRWDVHPAVTVGAEVEPGDVLATVAETAALVHRILVPPGQAGTVTAVHHGDASATDPIAWIDGAPIALAQRWPVRVPRPVAARLDVTEPLLTGQRALDVMFPVARGGTAAIPGGFGTGKTMLEQSLAKHASADVIVYIGCGERGNELTEVLEDFPHLVDPRTGGPLMDRTVIVANTSNMPVAAREASIYTGVTIAEYYRDQGYDVVLLADSTSRWAEALREVSGRLGELPAEDGYPAYLGNRIAQFYERAGAVTSLGGRPGSLTAIGAVSPAGGDFSEPVTQQTLRVTGTFWALDASLARARHYPAINWSTSYTQYRLEAWYADHAPGHQSLRAWASDVLAREAALLDVVQLVGPDALAPPERVTLRTGRLLRDAFLQQSAFDDHDAARPLDSHLAVLSALRAVHAAMLDAVGRDVPVEDVLSAPALAALPALRAEPDDSLAAAAERATADVITQLAAR